MSAIAFHTPNVHAQIPSDVISIEHPTGSLPKREAIVSALPVVNGKTQSKYDVLWFGGSHGNISGKGKPIQFNGCNNADEFVTFLTVLRDLGITADYIVADFCFSTAFLPEFYRLLEPNGKFAGWVSICGTQRHAQITGPVRNLVVDAEDNLEQIFPGTGSGQAIYGKKDRILIRYDHATLTSSMQTVDGSTQSEIDDAMAGISRLGHKRTLSTRKKTKWGLKLLFGSYYLTHDLVADMNANLYNSRTQFKARVTTFL
jgi:hypothetical protein